MVVVVVAEEGELITTLVLLQLNAQQLQMLNPAEMDYVSWSGVCKEPAKILINCRPVAGED